MTIFDFAARMVGRTEHFRTNTMSGYSESNAGTIWVDPDDLTESEQKEYEAVRLMLERKFQIQLKPL